MVSLEASRSATAGESFEMVCDKMVLVPALVSLDVLSSVGDGGETGVIATGAMV